MSDFLRHLATNLIASKAQYHNDLAYDTVLNSYSILKADIEKLA